MAQVRTRKRGKTWSYIFEAGTVNGKRKVVEKGGYPTKADAYKAGVSAYTDFLHGNIGITSESITLKDFMTNWLDNVVVLNVKPNSMQKYKSYFRAQIIPHLGNLKIQELTPAILDEYFRELLQKGLSRNSLLGIHSLLRVALNYAVYPAQLISVNPVVYIKISKSAPRNVIKRHIITLEQFRTLLDKYPFGTPFYMPLLLLYHTGMRLGEVLGLAWSDVDFVAKKINVRRQMINLVKRGYFLTSLKNESSNRYILIDDYLLGELRRWQNQQAENEKVLFFSSKGIVYSLNVYDFPEGGRQSKGLPTPEGEKVSLVCTRNDGRIVLRNFFVNTLTGEGLNAHSFRHTHATQLIEMGAAPKGVARRLGTRTCLSRKIFTRTTLVNYRRTQ